MTSFRKYITLIAILLTSGIQAQNYKASLQIGYGIYNMGTLSKITRSIDNSLPFESKIISNYPAYINYQPMLALSFDKLDLGVSYIFQSTGSRISSKDYSGEYKFDTRISAKCPGVFIKGTVLRFKYFNIGLTLNSGLVFSHLSLSEELNLEDYYDQTEYKYKSMSNYVLGDFDLIIPIKRFDVELNVGYFKEYKRNDYVSQTDQNDLYINDNFSDTDFWDSFRLAITASYYIKKR